MAIVCECAHRVLAFALHGAQAEGQASSRANVWCGTLQVSPGRHRWMPYARTASLWLAHDNNTGYTTGTLRSNFQKATRGQVLFLPIFFSGNFTKDLIFTMVPTEFAIAVCDTLYNKRKIRYTFGEGWPFFVFFLLSEKPVWWSVSEIYIECVGLAGDGRAILPKCFPSRHGISGPGHRAAPWQRQRRGGRVRRSRRHRPECAERHGAPRTA